MILRRSLWVGFLGLGFLLMAHAYRPAVAMVMDLHGAGTYQSLAGERPLALLMELPAGGPVFLREGASLVLVTMAKGESIHVSGPAKFQLDDQGRPSPPIPGQKAEPAKSLKLKDGLKPTGLAQAGLVAKLNQESLDGMVAARQAEKSLVGSLVSRPGGSTTAIGGSARLAGIDLLFPLGSTVREHRPEFRWKSWGVAAAYRFRLTTAEGQEIFMGEFKRPEGKLPKGLELEPGAAYRWDVLAPQPDGKECRATGRFTVLSREQEQVLAETRSLKTDPFHQRMLYAFLLEQYGLLTEAKAAWKQLLSERPEDPVLRTHAN